MSVDLQITLGAVAYTDYVHVTAAKVASPSSVAWEDWIPAPLPANYVFIIPGLDPDNYYITFYDSPDAVSLGTLVAQAYVKATNPEYGYELRFYEIGNLPVGATLDATRKIITDPYLVGKTAESFFKEGFRFLEPDVELQYDNSIGSMELTLPVGTEWEDLEKLVVTIKYAVGTISASANGLYKGILDVTDAVYSISAADRNKLLRLLGSAATQVLTLPTLASLTIDDGYYFDNSIGGVAVQVKVLTNGTDRIKFNGFFLPSNEFAEFWVSRGEHLLLRKIDDNYWEVRTDYKGVEVGNRMSAALKTMPAFIPEDGRLLDGDEYPRLWFYINSILDATHVITDDAVIGSYTHPVGREGQFVKHSTLKKFRMPNTQGLTERGLKDFGTYGAGTDATRIYNYPGGKQLAKVMKFWVGTFGSLKILKEDGTNTEIGTDAGAGPNIRIAVAVDQTKFHDTENISENIGVIYSVHI